MNIRPVKGTRDFYPEDFVFRQWLFGKQREAARAFGYEEYEGPILEPLELYTQKTSEELVNKQTFRLTDRSGNTLVLRPEMTPSVSRMVAQRQPELLKPIKWFNIGPRFRYEQPQKGRAREFYQWDVDVFGIDSPLADAEIIAVACTFLASVGLTPKEVQIKINDRRLMEEELTEGVGLKKSQLSNALTLIDQLGKLSQSEKEKYATSLGFSAQQLADIIALIRDTDYRYESEWLTELFSTIADLGFAEYVTYDPSVVRGLLYYSGTVFEAFDRKGKFRAILGGGRYDSLVGLLSGKPIPAVGFACGDMIIEEALRQYDKVPSLSPTPTQVLVTVFDLSLTRASLLMAKALRDKGVRAELYLTQAPLSAQLSYASKKQVPFVVIIGPDEEPREQATIKNMQTGEQRTENQTEVAEIILKNLYY